MSGLTASGFERKRLVDIILNIEERWRAIFGDNVDTAAQSVFGQIIGIFSELLSDEWESQENTYNAMYPSTAQGNQLSNVVLLNGIERQEATFSTVVATLGGVPGTTIPAGSLASVVGTEEVFATDEDVTLVSDSIEVNMTAVNSGPIAASIGTLTQIETPVFGWTSITNASVASLGTDEETDAELRERRELSTQALGQNLVDSLFGQLLNLDGVTDALVISNGQNVTVDGIPPHQFLSVVIGGDDDEIAQAIWLNTPQGILSFGSTTVIVSDAQGFPQETKFSRPTPILIYFRIDITIDTDIISTPEAEAEAELEIQTNVVEYGVEVFGIGNDVIRTQFFTPVNLTEGILTAEIYIGLSSSPSGTSNIPIAFEELPSFDTTNVEVNIV